MLFLVFSVTTVDAHLRHGQSFQITRSVYVQPIGLQAALSVTIPGSLHGSEFLEFQFHFGFKYALGLSCFSFCLSNFVCLFTRFSSLLILRFDFLLESQFSWVSSLPQIPLCDNCFCLLVLVCFPSVMFVYFQLYFGLCGVFFPFVDYLPTSLINGSFLAHSCLHLGPHSTSHDDTFSLLFAKERRCF